ncbi:type II toxin-antitoxin system Phd/YefM family antitoxin [Anaerosporobacter sp.]|uniref:type II toxin-antitoxin system Phd/YefM family antitoxin n=1 Tax=Anaerosporobacter sp. TaxID=1872529 RepID=UPI00286EF5A6|nr:type II toxin-antitoxin system Phd/YefM family antitoxin [Anaerosporobacter sp.]
MYKLIIYNKKGSDIIHIDSNNLVFITEANQDFSKIARMVDEDGVAAILKNNAPRDVLLDYSKIQEDSIVEDEKLEDIASRILKKHIKAFEEFAK